MQCHAKLCFSLLFEEFYVLLQTAQPATFRPIHQLQSSMYGTLSFHEMSIPQYSLAKPTRRSGSSHAGRVSHMTTYISHMNCASASDSMNTGTFEQLRNSSSSCLAAAPCTHAAVRRNGLFFFFCTLGMHYARTFVSLNWLIVAAQMLHKCIKMYKVGSSNGESRTLECSGNSKCYPSCYAGLNNSHSRPNVRGRSDRRFCVCIIT
jgi:hypothetical protein